MPGLASSMPIDAERGCRAGAMESARVGVMAPAHKPSRAGLREDAAGIEIFDFFRAAVIAADRGDALMPWHFAPQP